MIDWIIGILAFVIVLSIIIIIHEGGHFLVARLCKVKVNEFAIGFGKTIWQKQGKETKYTIRLIPLGGLNEIGKNMTVLEYGKDIIVERLYQFVDGE